MLDQDGKVPGCIKMDELLLIQNDGHYGKNFQPEEGKIYVLVVVPEEQSAKKLPTAQMIKEVHEKIVKNKRKKYAHSKVDASNGKKLLQALNIHVDPVDTVPFATRDSIPVPAFRWANATDEHGQEITLTEEEQRQRYLSYVEDNFGSVLAEKKLCVLGVDKGEHIISVAVPGYDIDLVGRTDILVLSDIVKNNHF